MRSSVRSTASDSEAGFTLLEIVMVITLMALLSSIYISHSGLDISSPEDRIVLAQQESLIRARAAHMQTEAILMKRECSLEFGVSSMTYSDGCKPMPGEAKTVPYLEGISLIDGDGSMIKADKNGFIVSADEIKLEKNSVTSSFRLTEGITTAAAGGD